MKTTARGLTLLAAAAAALSPSASLATGEEGGSGLIRIGQAYSLPIGRPLLSVYAGYYTSNPTSSDRLFTLIPSATFGLGSGFEAAGALPLEGATLALEDDPYDRRFDVRHRDLLGRVRWTGNLKTTRFRIGAEGTLGAPLGGRTREGGDRSPQTSLDPGVSVLLSTNVGAFDFPIRLHANAGWYWSRNDGAFYYRSYPAAIPVPGGADAGNDVGWAGIGLEAGLRRATVIIELLTEHLQEARVEVHGRENLWMLTTGFRTALTRTVGLTGGISFDLSSDDDATAFDPDTVFPDAEIRVGLTLGTVLSREEYETRKRAEAEARKKRPSGAATAPSSFTTTGGADRASGHVDVDAGRIAELEAKVRDLDTRLRLEFLENRLRQLEGRESAETPRESAPAPVGPPAAAPATPSASTPPASAPDPLAGEDARRALDQWARALVENPGASVVVTVWGGGPDRDQALRTTETQARAVRDYLVRAGAGPGQIRALGMGAPPDSSPARIEIDWVR